MLAHIVVTHKAGTPDADSEDIRRKLDQYGVTKDARRGKYFMVVLTEEDVGKAKALVKDLCEKVLINPIYEEYRFWLSDGSVEKPLGSKAYAVP